MSNILSNFFSHLKNAQKSRILVIEHPQSKILVALSNTLQECGYIRGYRLLNNNIDSTKNTKHVENSLSSSSLAVSSFPKIEILLKYKNQKPAINNIIRISKPSKRVYYSVKKLSHLLIKKTNNNMVTKNEGHLVPSMFMKGILILSTSKGIMTHLTAYRLNIGGEVLCHVF